MKAVEPPYRRHHAFSPQTIPSPGPEQLSAAAGRPSRLHYGRNRSAGLRYGRFLRCADTVVIIHHHYSHRVVNNSYLHLGVFHEGAFEGVLQWGYALNPARAGKVVEGTVQGQYLELNRMWLSDDAPRNSESRAISYALKYIRRACPGVAWVQSFADERCNGLGVVYQACSFLYVGYHVSTFYELDGEVYHKIIATNLTRSGNRGKRLRENLHRARIIKLRQFRYVRFLKTDWRKRLRLPVCPYPKRAAN